MTPPILQGGNVALAKAYRHQGAWKFRAVGQGFAEGLRVLAENFGVDVD